MQKTTEYTGMFIVNVPIYQHECSPDFHDGSVDFIVDILFRYLVHTLDGRFDLSRYIFVRIAVGVVEMLIPVLQ